MSEFKIGDVVRLKSATIPMTVVDNQESNRGGRMIRVAWFWEDGELRLGNMPAEALVQHERYIKGEVTNGQQ